MSEVRIVESMAIVVPVFDHLGLEFPKDFIPCEPEYAYGYVVYSWDAKTGQFGIADSEMFETVDDAMGHAEKLHRSLCEQGGINP